MLSLTFTTFLIKSVFLKPLAVVLQVSKLLIGNTSLLAQCYNTFKSHTPIPCSISESPLASALCVSSCSLFLSFQQTVVRNSVAHLSHTTQYSTEMRYIGFLCVSQTWRGVQSNKTQSFFSCCSRTCPAHFVAQTQLCRTVLSNSISVQDYLSHQIHQA